LWICFYMSTLYFLRYRLWMNGLQTMNLTAIVPRGQKNNRAAETAQNHVVCASCAFAQTNKSDFKQDTAACVRWKASPAWAWQTPCVKPCAVTTTVHMNTVVVQHEPQLTLKIVIHSLCPAQCKCVSSHACAWTAWSAPRATRCCIWISWPARVAAARVPAMSAAGAVSAAVRSA
jgi:hypothetical protein